MKIHLLPFCRYFYTYNFSSHLLTTSNWQENIKLFTFGPWMWPPHQPKVGSDTPKWRLTTMSFVFTLHGYICWTFGLCIDHPDPPDTWWDTGIQKISSHPKAFCHLPHKPWKWDASYKDAKKEEKIVFMWFELCEASPNPNALDVSSSSLWQTSPWKR